MHRFVCGMLVVVTSAFGVGGASARAAAISGLVTVGTAQTGGGNFNSVTNSSTNVPNSYTSLGTVFSNPNAPHWVNLSTNSFGATNLGQAMSVTFNQDGTLVTDPTTYLYTVTMTNNTTKPIQPVTFTLANNGTSAFFNYAAATPTSTYQPWSDPNGLQATSLTFGGLSGGGGELMPGQSATFTFAVTLPGAANGTFTLSMTPNPEPSSLALAGVACVGGLIARRRRNRKVGVQPTAAVA